MTLIGEHIPSPTGMLDYWRVERADSVVVVPVQGDRLLLPPPVWRPGVGAATLDFPGGRIAAGQSVEAAAIAVLQRELHCSIEPAALSRLNHQGWPINSSFSDQHLFGCVAQIPADWSPPPSLTLTAYGLTPGDLRVLLADLTCLQCRAVLLEWWMTGAGDRGGDVFSHSSPDRS
jgi:hypothetical protein